MEPERFGEEHSSNGNYLTLNSVPEADRISPSLKIFELSIVSHLYGLVYKQLFCSEEMKWLQNYMFGPKVQIFILYFGWDFFPIFIRISLKMSILEMHVIVNCEIIFHLFFWTRKYSVNQLSNSVLYNCLISMTISLVAKYSNLALKHIDKLVFWNPTGRSFQNKSFTVVASQDRRFLLKSKGTSRPVPSLLPPR